MPNTGKIPINQRDLLAPFRKRISKKEQAYEASTQYSSLIIQLIRHLAEKESLTVSIFSTGSLSRNELLPFVAVDLIYAADSADEMAASRTKLNNIEDGLESAGLTVNHTLVTPNKNLASSIPLITKIMESKPLYGNSKLHTKLVERCREDFAKKDTDKIIDDICEEHTLRFKKFGSSPKMTEPSVKLSAGCLRDLHTMYWIALLLKNNTADASIKAPKASLTPPYIQIVMEFLSEYKLLPENHIKELPSNHAELLTARYYLFRLNLKKVDRLETSDQISIAEKLGYKGEQAFRGYMRNFIRAVSSVNSAMYAIKKWRIEKLVEFLPDTLRIPIDDVFYLKGGLLFCIADEVLTLTDALKACYYQAEYKVTFSQSCRKAILEHEKDEPGDFSAETISYFKKIFSSSKSIGTAIYSMNELGLFPEIAPQFKDIEGFTESNYTQFYSVDEHTVKTIVHFEEFESRNDIIGKVFQMVQDKTICRLALFFHDIAKPDSIEGHPLFGSEIAASVLERFGYDDEVATAVIFLVKNHLLMEEYSFIKENIAEVDIRTFAAKIPSLDMLQYLFLIVIADMSALNPVYWTSWKQELLIQLFLESIKILEAKESSRDAINYLDDGEHPISEVYNSFQSEHLIHLHAMTDDDYFTKYSRQEIGEHIKLISLGHQLSVIWTEDSHGAKVTIITKDFPYLLARICGAFSIFELNILSAMIFSRQDGVAIATFTISDMKKRDLTEKMFQDQFYERLDEAINGVLQVADELTQIRLRWKAIEQFFRKKGSVKVKFDEDERFSIIEVFAPDRLGLLYHVSKKLSDLGLTIYFAKINTNNNEISDVFYILDRHKKKISTNYYHFIENELITLIENLV